MSSAQQDSGSTNDATPEGRRHPLEATAALESPTSECAAWELTDTRYRIVGEIARGGMGVVLRARDARFDRALAIKVLLRSGTTAANHEARFLEEASITAQLEHPGIPPVHDMGRLTDGRPYFCMKLIEGRTLSELLWDRPTPQAELAGFLTIFEQIAQTVAYAHSRSIIHRDLKPLNIMVGAFREVQVMDWGLAKRLTREKPANDAGPETPNVDASAAPEESESAGADTGGPHDGGSHTHAGQVLGTFAYMAPEQARGEVHELDERCDVFGLGAILCTILTGRPPYHGREESVFNQAHKADLSRAWACLDACGADGELVKLAKACLAPSKEDRPRDAGEVAAAATTYLASVQERLQQVRVAHAQSEIKAAEARKRNRLAVSLAALVILVVVAAGAAWLWYQRDQATRQAEIVARQSYLESEVSSALGEAERHRLELHRRLRDDQLAAQLLSDPEEWRGLLEAAQGAWKRADRLAAPEPDMLSVELRDRLETVGEQLQADETDRQLAFALDRIRMETSNLIEGRVRLQSAAPKLARAFQNAGYNLLTESPGSNGARIRASAIRLPLVAGLDFWALATDDWALRGRLLEAARAADADPWRDRFRQTAVWNDHAALKAMADEVDCPSQSAHLLAALAQRLSDFGSEGATPLLRRALVSHSGDFWLHFELGLVSRNPNEQIGAFRAALAVRPQAAVAHYNIGVLQNGEKRREEAVLSYLRSIELDPANSAGVHSNLGIVLDDLGRHDEAMVHFRTAVKLEPDNFFAQINLGAALHGRGELSEAVVCFRAAVALAPESAAAHNNLGGALRGQKKFDEAVVHYRMALKIDPLHVMAWCNLGHTLRQQGNFKEGLEALRKGHELGSRQKGWPHPSGFWVLQAEHSVALDQKLSAVLRGEAEPANALERAGMAELCLMHRKLYATAARFYAAAFTAQPKLAEGPPASRRYDAARAAILAAAGEGQDAKELSAADRDDFRKRARGWLRDALTKHAAALEKDPQLKGSVAQTLREWQTDDDLVTVRDATALARLSPGERKSWEQLWTDVAALRERAGKANP